MKKEIIDVHTHSGIDYCNFYRGTSDRVLDELVKQVL